MNTVQDVPPRNAHAAQLVSAAKMHKFEGECTHVCRTRIRQNAHSYEHPCSANAPVGRKGCGFCEIQVLYVFAHCVFWSQDSLTLELMSHQLDHAVIFRCQSFICDLTVICGVWSLSCQWMSGKFMFTVSVQGIHLVSTCTHDVASLILFQMHMSWDGKKLNSISPSMYTIPSTTFSFEVPWNCFESYMFHLNPGRFLNPA